MSTKAKDLVDRWREGDQDAATELYERYFEQLINIISGNLMERYQSHFDSEDVLMSAFRTVLVRVTNGEFRFEDDDDVWKLLVTVSLNKLRKKVRHHQTGKRNIDLETRGSSDFDGTLAGQLTLSPGVFEAVEFADLVKTAMSILSDRERSILLLRLEGFSQQEIASKLEITDRTVRRCWEKIRERLEFLLGDDHE